MALSSTTCELLRCPLCRDVLGVSTKDRLVRCKVCRAPYHQACFREWGCSTTACEHRRLPAGTYDPLVQTPAKTNAKPSPNPLTRRRLKLLAGGLIGLVGVGFLAAYAPSDRKNPPWVRVCHLPEVDHVAEKREELIAWHLKWVAHYERPVIPYDHAVLRSMTLDELESEQARKRDLLPGIRALEAGK